MPQEQIPNKVISTLLDVHKLLAQLSDEGLLDQCTLHPTFVNNVCDAVAQHLKDTHNV